MKPGLKDVGSAFLKYLPFSLKSDSNRWKHYNNNPIKNIGSCTRCFARLVQKYII